MRRLPDGYTLLLERAHAAGPDPNRAARWTRVRAEAEALSPEIADDPAWADRLRRTAQALATD